MRPPWTVILAGRRRTDGQGSGARAARVEMRHSGRGAGGGGGGRGQEEEEGRRAQRRQAVRLSGCQAVRQVDRQTGSTESGTPPVDIDGTHTHAGRKNEAGRVFNDREGGPRQQRPKLRPPFAAEALGVRVICTAVRPSQTQRRAGVSRARRPGRSDWRAASTAHAVMAGIATPWATGRLPGVVERWLGCLAGWLWLAGWWPGRVGRAATSEVWLAVWLSVWPGLAAAGRQGRPSWL